MKLLRVGARGAERPAVLDAGGIARDVSGIAGDFGPAFFAGDGPRRVAAALSRGGLSQADASGRIHGPTAQPPR